MKTYIHEYKGFGIHPSRCKIYIQTVGIQTWIGFENLGEGTSVTNASEQLASEIVEKELLNPISCKFFEWYPEYEGNVSEVTYRWKGPEASHAEWSHYCRPESNPFLTGDFPFDE
jgi:hypothetical protein